jgi:hypothetical protein
MIRAYNALPAMRVLAVLLSLSLSLPRSAFRLGKLRVAFLAEVKAFCWMNLTANSLLKVLVRDLAVFVCVKLVK